MQWLKKAVEHLLYSNIFIGACAVALTFTNQLTVEGQIQFDDTCWFIFFSTVFTYSYLKLTSSSGQVYTSTHRNWAAEYPQLSKNIMLISLIATAVFFFQLNNNVKLIVLGLGVFTAFYGFVKIPFGKNSIKLRDFGLLKTAFVAIVWSITTVVVPLAAGYVEPQMIVFLLLRRFLFIMALTMVFEIKDMTGDLNAGIKTIPIAIGISNTKLLAQGLLFALMLITSVQFFFFDVALYNMLAINLSLLVSIICIQPLEESTPDGWYYFVLDGMMILQFVFVYGAAKIFQ